MKLIYDNSDHRVGQLLLGVDIIYCNPRIMQYILRTSIPQGPWIAITCLDIGNSSIFTFSKHGGKNFKEYIPF